MGQKKVLRVSVLISEVEQEWYYFGRTKVSCLKRCPQFMGVLIEGPGLPNIMCSSTRESIICSDI